MNKELNKIVPNKTRKRALTIMYVGLGMNLFGFAAFDPLGSFFENLGLLIMAVGVGFMAAFAWIVFGFLMLIFSWGDYQEYHAERSS